MLEDPPSHLWRKSRFCDSNQCVEVAVTPQVVALRDSKNPNGPVLNFTHPEWRAFLAGVEAGDFRLN